jgi:L-lysine 6-transaminase
MTAKQGVFRLSANEVHEALAHHMLVDGFHMVPDLARSHGSYLIDERDGHEYLDLFSNFGSQALGWNHPGLGDPEFRERLLLAALHKPANSDLYSRFFADFLETFSHCAVPASHSSHVFLVEGGALAVENALKTAFDWKIRSNWAKGAGGEHGLKVIHFRQAFHGRTGYTMSITNTDPRKTALFPKFDWPRIANPKIIFPLAEHLAEVETAERHAVGEIEETIARFGPEIACLIIEPIQAEGGDNHFRPEFLRRLRELADAHEFLLIFDEVQTGLGLTGSMWAWQGLGVEPDIFCFGKKVQTCGIACNSRIDTVRDNVFKVSSRINSTWGGNLTDMVRATRVIEIVCQDKLVDNAASMGRTLLAGLADLATQYPRLISQVRGRGLMIAFDFPTSDVRNNAIVACREQSVLVLPCGDRSIRFRPFLEITGEDCTVAIERIGRALHSMK